MTPPPIRILFDATLLVVVLAWVLFRASDLTYAWAFWRNMLGLLPVKQAFGLAHYFPCLEVAIGVIALALAGGVGRRLLTIEAFARWRRFASDAFLLILVVISLAFLAGGAYNPFIYFRF